MSKQRSNSLRQIIIRSLIVLFCLLTIVHVAALIPQMVGLGVGRPFNHLLLVGSLLITMISTIGGAALAILFALRSWDVHGARSFASFLLYATLCWGIMLRGFEFDIDAAGALLVSAGDTSFWWQALMVGSLPLVAGAFLRLSVLYPEPFNSDKIGQTGRFKWLRRLRVLISSAKGVWGFLWPLIAVQFLLWFLLDISSETGVADAPAMIGTLWLVFCIFVPFIYIIIALIAGTRNFWDDYLYASNENRKRLLWLLNGIAISVAMILIPLISTPVLAANEDIIWLLNLFYVLQSLSPGVFVLSIFIAVFFSGIIDPALILARSTVIGILTTVWIGLYAALEGLLAGWLQNTLGLPTAIASALVALTAALIAIPFRRVLKPMLKRVGGAIQEAPPAQ